MLLDASSLHYPSLLLHLCCTCKHRMSHHCCLISNSSIAIVTKKKTIYLLTWVVVLDIFSSWRSENGTLHRNADRGSGVDSCMFPLSGISRVWLAPLLHNPDFRDFLLLCNKPTNVLKLVTHVPKAKWLHWVILMITINIQWIIAHVIKRVYIIYKLHKKYEVDFHYFFGNNKG